MAMACCTVAPYHGQFPRLPWMSSFKSSLNLNVRRRLTVRKAQGPRVPTVAAEKSDVYKLVGTIWKTSKDVLEAGSKLVPESVPRPVARAGVALGGLVVISFILKSILSTALFILGVVGLIYFVFIYLNKDEGPRGGSIDDEEGSVDETLEEARRIMDKYK